MNTTSIIGKQFGKLTAVSLTDKKDKCSRAYFRCICDCGTEIITNGYNLTSGRSKSCGCSRKVCKSKVQDRTLQITKRLYAFRIVHGSRDRGIAADLPFETFRSLISKQCHYCGIEPQGIARDIKVLDANGERTRFVSDTVVRYNGLDRVNNALGYIASNVVPCCKTCNLAKRTMGEAEFTQWIARVYRHTLSKETGVNVSRLRAIQGGTPTPTEEDITTPEEQKKAA